MGTMNVTFPELEHLINMGWNLMLLEAIYDERFSVLIGTEKTLTIKDTQKVRERLPQRLSQMVLVKTTIPHFIEEEKRNQWAVYITSVFDQTEQYKGLSKENKDFVLKNIKNVICRNDYLVWKLSQMKNFSKKLFNHTLNTLFISLLAYFSYSKSNHSGMIDAGLIENVINSAVLHDAGFLKADPALLEKKRIEMISENSSQFKMHPVESCNIIKSESSRNEVSEECLEAIVNHEEFLDGSGSPQGIKGEKMTLLSRILSISNYFELALSNELNIKNRHYRDQIGRLRLEKSKFDKDIMNGIDLTFKYLFNS